MLRFPNPGSTIDNFVRVYSAAFDALYGRTVNLDEIVEAVVKANLATSSGYMGAEAVTRSTRDDRNFDPLYNQAKMYAELFRTMGWLQPTAERSLKFTFTLLGEQLVAAGRAYWPLFEECILGIAYPTHVLAVKGSFDLRPFAFLLRSMTANGGYLSRDEMIIGPLSAQSDRTPQVVAATNAMIATARMSAAAISIELETLAIKRKIQVNTLRNYTRWPIAVLRDSGWAKEYKGYYGDGRAYDVWKLTEKGSAVSERVNNALDLRLSDVEPKELKERIALATIAHYQMLERAGFDVEPMRERLIAAEKVTKSVTQIPATGTLLFSPFQSLSLNDIQAAFPTQIKAPVVDVDKPIEGQRTHAGRDSRSHLFVEPSFVAAPTTTNVEANTVHAELSALMDQYRSIPAAAAAFAVNHIKDTQTIFYPLVTHLFHLMGYRSEYSRAGVNYQRWDACLWIEEDALPVEIKSPTEEEFLSTKAVRQALENKIVLLSRGGLKTRKDVASFIVGYRLPSERGDMSNLIDNIFEAFGLRLGVIDLQSLAHLALLSIIEGKMINGKQLAGLRGFLDV